MQRIALYLLLGSLALADKRAAALSVTYGPRRSLVSTSNT